jgi:UPF0755 protein
MLGLKIKRYKFKPPVRRQRRSVWLITVVLIGLIVIGGAVGVHIQYNHNLQPVSSSTTAKYFTVSSGVGINQIAVNLQQAGLIRSAGAFETYVRDKELQASLQAGTYSLSPSMSTQQIVDKMVKGEVTKNLLTILPGLRVDQIEQAFAKSGYSQAEIDTVFNPVTYAGNPALTSLPAGAGLEGYLYPDSFQKEAGTPAATIVQESLNEMAQQLTPDIIQGFSVQGLSTYRGITLASIVLQESGDAAQEPTIAQVFISRLKQGMMLQSNVTADYAADIAGVPRSVNIDSPYNTYLHAGLPPGPISNVTAAALKAVAHPSNTNYLYFIAGDDGKIHYSDTQAEQNQAIQQYCPTTCAQP